MIDTLNMWIDRSNMAGGDTFAILPFLSDIEEKNSETKGYSYSGHLDSYDIRINQARIVIAGSLPQYFLPSNLYTLSRSTMQEALEKMSDELHTDIMAAKVWRFDIAALFPTKRPPADYFSCLGEKDRFRRLQATAETLYYSTAQRQLICYDKTKEAAAKGAIVPPDLTDCNLFRYELRYKENLQRQLKLNEPLTAGKLIDQDFYLKIVYLWRDEFRTIKKIKTISAMSGQIKKPKDALSLFYAKAIQKAGFTQQEINDYINDLKADRVFDDPKAYTRMKADLYKMLQIKPDEQNELAKELEQTINDIAFYAR